jgi:serine/threonine protein kinase/serine phosphatase RsbU (regulator of sigma subunit)
VFRAIREISAENQLEDGELGFRIGQKLKEGRYEIQRLLGTGGFGEVYLAFHYEGSKVHEVAIKRFLVPPSQEAIEQAEALRNESFLLSEFSDPHVVRVLGYEVEDGVTFLVEEFLQGGNLQELIEKKGALPVLDFLELAAKLAQGLDVIHTKGIYHCDIKLRNICFRDVAQTEPVFVDFGHGDLVDAGLLKGSDPGLAATLTYLPPERTGFVNEPVSAASDLYSLGVCLFELASGSRPIKGENAREIVGNILSHVPSSLVELCSYPGPVDQIIQKLLRKLPSERYHSAAGLIADLRFCESLIRNNEPLRPFALGRSDRIRELNFMVPMIGRAEEERRLQEALQKTLASKGQIFAIGAPSGTGKSRLAGELIREAKKSGMHIVSAKFSEFEKNVPLGGLSYALQNHSQWLRTLPLEERKKWATELLSELGAQGNFLARRFPFYQDLLPRFPVINKLDSEEESKLFAQALAQFLTLLTVQEQGCVIFLDDLQWADVATLSVLKCLAQRNSQEKFGRTLLIGTYRSDEVPHDHLLYSQFLVELPIENNLLLGPLRRAESDELVGLLLDETGVEVEALQAHTFLLTNGNPFFIYEYLKAALNSGIFAPRPDGKGWYFNRAMADSIAMTDGVAGLVSKRLMRLPLMAFEIIKVASVIGSKVSFVDLCLLSSEWLSGKVIDGTLIAGSVREIEQIVKFALDQLRRDHLILPNEHELVFFHDKIKEATLSALKEDEKKALHTHWGFLLAKQVKSQARPSVGMQSVFEAAFHLSLGDISSDPALARYILAFAGEKAIQVFSYAKARDFLRVASKTLSSPLRENTGDLNVTSADALEWCDINEMLADTMALSEEVEQAILIYEEVLLYVREPLRMADIYAKEAENHIALFQYKKSINAGHKGLDALKIGRFRHIRTEWQALTLFIFALSYLMFVMFLKLFLRRPWKTIQSGRQEIELRLFSTLQVSYYFTRPFIAIVNQIIKFAPQLFYKDNFYKATMYGYWGIVWACLGREKWSYSCYEKCFHYFNANPNPVQYGFFLMTKGYSLEFPHGHLKASLENLELSVKTLSGVGETFSRLIVLQALCHVDFFGAGNGRSASASYELLEFWKKVHFESTLMGVMLKFHLFADRLDEVDSWSAIVQRGGQNIAAQGYSSIDLVFAAISCGEAHLYRENYDKAIPLLEVAFFHALRGPHRLTYAYAAGPLLALGYVRSGRPWKALLPLAMSWLNCMMNVRVFKPQSFYATGEFFFCLGFSNLGEVFMRKGIRYAKLQLWECIAAEGQLLLAKQLRNRDLSEAKMLCREAKSYFSERGNRFLERQCNEILGVSLVSSSSSKERLLRETQEQTSGSSMHSMRQHIESSALLDMFLKLSELTEKGPLLAELLEVLCSCTGSEHAFVLLRDSEGQWNVENARNLSSESLRLGSYESLGVDRIFLESFLSEMPLKGRSNRESSIKENAQEMGSAMLLPLLYKDDFLGVIYLGNRHITQLFDERSIQICLPLVSQAAIALNNFHLIADREANIRLDMELKAASALQESLLVEPPTIEGLDIKTHYQPASQIGGDWFGFHVTESNQCLYLFVGDVTGHGFPSALMTAVVCGSVYAAEDVLQEMDSNADWTVQARLKRVAEVINRVLLKTAQGRLGVTMAMIALELNTGKVSFLNAGHTPLFWLQRSEDHVKPIVKAGGMLGFRDEPDFVVTEFELQSGDGIFLYTDGLIENCGPNQMSMSGRVMRNLLQNAPDAESCITSLLHEGERIWQQVPPEDDCTLVSLTWKHPVSALRSKEVTTSQRVQDDADSQELENRKIAV